MKTVFISGSPKKRFSASDYFISVQRLFVRGEKVREKLRNKGDHKRILSALSGADAVVFSVPMYVDGVPSHVLEFMKEMEVFCRKNSIRLSVYAISNGGFIEGNQNASVLKTFESFCIRSGLSWCGGIGIGGGVMLNVLKIVLLVLLGVLAMSVLVSGIGYGDWFPREAFTDFLINALVTLFLSSGVLFCAIKMGSAINRGTPTKNRYTRILIPSFIFIIIADIFFTVISIFKGGIFRGWLSRK